MSDLYNIAVVHITDKSGIPFKYITKRTDDRSPDEVYRDGINGFYNGANAVIYHALLDSIDVSVQTVFKGLSKAQAKSKYETLIRYERALGTNILNQLYKN